MARFLSVFVLMFIVAGLAALGFHERPTPHADFTYAISGSIKTLDPARLSWNEDIRIALGLWEGLATYDPVTAQAIPGAAYLPPKITNNGKTYLFTLRPDGKWSNGDPVTASDFVYGWRRAIEPGTAGDYAFLFTDNIKGAKAYSDWRNNAVHVLTILRDINNNKDISKQDRQFLLQQRQHLSGITDTIVKLLQSPSATTAQINSAVNWKNIADKFRRHHLAQMNTKFAQVGIKALDDYHLQVKLTHPITYFVDLTAFSTFLPVHKKSLEKMRQNNDPTVRDLTLWAYNPQWVKPWPGPNGYPGLITNGAYKLSGWEFKRYMLFTRNPFYWDRKNVKCNSIMARIITEPSTTFLAYERGEIDWFNALTRLDFAPALVQKMKSGQRKDIYECTAFGTYFYVFNCKQKLQDGSDNPFKDPRVRMAFDLAVDKQSLVDNVKKVGNKVALNLIPPNSIKGYYCPPGPVYNVKRARKLLAEAGYPDGKGLPVIDILYNTGSGHEAIAGAISEMWRNNLHVQTSMRGKETKSFDDDRKNQRFMICRMGWYGDYSDPTTFLDMMVTGNGQNDSAFSNPKYDKLMKDAAACPNPTERFKILAQAENMLMQKQMPILPLYHYINLMAIKPYVKGLYPNARDIHPFKNIYIEPH